MNSIQSSNFNPLHERISQELRYENLVNEFRTIEYGRDRQSWLRRAEILDELHLNYGHFPRLSPGKYFGKKRSRSDIFLVSYDAIKNANKVLKHSCNPKLDNIPGLETELQGTARWVRILTKQSFRNPVIALLVKIVRRIFRLLTNVSGHVHNRRSGPSSIAKFSIKLGIDSALVVPIRAQSGDVCSVYAGPKEAYGKKISDYKSKNEWFIRNLTPEVKRHFLSTALKKEHKMAEKYGFTLNVSRVVISNSFCRLRLARLKPGEMSVKQELTGKVLNEAAEIQAKELGDEKTYYQEKYRFSPKNLFGRKDSDPVEPSQIPEELYLTGKSEKTLKHELLGHMYRFLDRQGAIQVIQRLAPEDIHTYCASVNGRPLTSQEAAVTLAEYIEKQKTHCSDPDSLRAFEEEIDQLRRLQSYFQAWNAENVTIDIHGTNDSVSTPAIKHRSSILSQNDRKIMMYLHKDGSFSFHVFIGATQVNRVTVNQSNVETDQGDTQGSMSYGGENSRPKLRLGEHVGFGLSKQSGQTLGSFPINGSTVISYYLPNEFAILSKLEKFTDRAHYKQAGKRQVLEIKAPMGAPLLKKKEILAAEKIEKLLKTEWSSFKNADQVLNRFFKIKTDNSFLIKIRCLINKTNKSYEDSLFVDALKSCINFRLNNR